MQTFEYASPDDVCTEALGAARLQVGRGRCAGRRHRSDQPDEGVRSHAQAGGEYQRHQGTARSHRTPARVSASARPPRSTNSPPKIAVRAEYPSLVTAALGITSPQIRNMGTVGGDLCQRPRCWYFRRATACSALKDGKSLVPNGAERIPRDLRRRTGLLRQPVQPRSRPGGSGRAGEAGLGHRQPRWCRPRNSSSARRTTRPARSRCCRTKSSPRSSIPPAHGIEERDLRSAPEGGARLAAGDRVGRAHDEGRTRSRTPRVVLGHVAPTPWVATAGRAGAGRQIAHRRRDRQSRGSGRRRTPRRSARTPTKCNWPRSPSSARCSRPRAGRKHGLDKERSSLTRLDDDRCDNLRWKGMYVEAEWDPTVPHSMDRLFWCQKTQQCLGPDGKLVDDYECNPARKCYHPF